MKISFDINGVLDTYPELLALAWLLKNSGHSVGILTGNSSASIPKEAYNIWDFIITCDSPEEEFKLTGNVAKTDAEKMRYWKSAALKENHIDLHFDDWADVMEGPVVRIGLPKGGDV